jgi:hypothetical protein
MSNKVKFRYFENNPDTCNKDDKMEYYEGETMKATEKEVHECVDDILDCIYYVPADLYNYIMKCYILNNKKRNVMKIGTFYEDFKKINFKVDSKKEVHDLIDEIIKTKEYSSTELFYEIKEWFIEEDKDRRRERMFKFISRIHERRVGS